MTDINNEYLKSRIYLELSIIIPEHSKRYQKWAEIFLGQENWPAATGSTTDGASSVFNYTYIGSIIHFYRLLCELVRLPTFDTPKLLSLSEDKFYPSKCTIKIESSLDNLISKSVYKSLIRSALESER